MNEPRTYKASDEVRVFDVNGNRMGQPEGGWPGTITKVGRVYVTIAYPGHNGQQFHIDTGRSNDAYGHRWFRTPTEVSEDARRAAATEQLRKLGLEVRLSQVKRFTADRLEQIVALVSGFDA